MISDAYVRVECDEGGCTEQEEIQLTALMVRASWDERNVKSELERLGWVIDGDVTTCELHHEDEEDEE